MDPITIGALGLVAMLALIIIGVPLAFSMGVVGVLGYVAVTDWQPAIAQLGSVTWEYGNDFLLIAVPLFLLMGQLVYHTGIASDLYACLYRWFGRLPGGIAVSTVGACAGFGAVTGSSLASVATMGTMVMPEMRRYGYNERLATGCIASAGTLAILIPPSILMVLYGVWTETSIGRLFTAGVVPGILLAGAFCLYVIVRCTIRPEDGPRGPAFSWGERFRSLAGLLPVMAIFLFILGGIYGGIVTPTEASALGVVSVLLVAGLMGRLSWDAIKKSLIEAGILGATLFFIIVAGTLFSRFLAVTQVSQIVVEFFTSEGINPYYLIIGIALMYVVLGCVLDTLGMLILTLPFVFPIITAAGFDPVWFGVFITIIAEIALITPPIGINVYVLKNVVPDIPASEMFHGVLPFVVIGIAILILLTAVPGLALWLPSTMN